MNFYPVVINSNKKQIRRELLHIELTELIFYGQDINLGKISKDDLIYYRMGALDEVVYLGE